MKKIASLMLAILMLLSFAVTASAAESSTKDGLQVTLSTNQDAYFNGECVNVTIKIKNNNSFAVKDVSVETVLPEGLTAKDSSQLVSKLSLKAGETKSVSLNVCPETIPDLPIHIGPKPSNDGGKPGKPGKHDRDNCKIKDCHECEIVDYNDLGSDAFLPTDAPCADDECLPTDECTKDKGKDKGRDKCKGDGTCDGNCHCKQPDTGDSFNAFLWVAILMFAVAAGALVLKGNKKAIKTMCLLFCLLMVLAAVPVNTLAADGVITVDKRISVEDVEYVIAAHVEYTLDIEAGLDAELESAEPEATTSVVDAISGAISGAIEDLASDDETLGKLAELFK